MSDDIVASAMTDMAAMIQKQKAALEAKDAEIADAIACCDSYATENQQFSDKIEEQNAEIEGLRDERAANVEMYETLILDLKIDIAELFKANGEAATIVAKQDAEIAELKARLEGCRHKRADLT